MPKQAASDYWRCGIVKLPHYDGHGKVPMFAYKALFTALEDVLSECSIQSHYGHVPPRLKVTIWPPSGGYGRTFIGNQQKMMHWYWDWKHELTKQMVQAADIALGLNDPVDEMMDDVWGEEEILDAVYGTDYDQPDDGPDFDDTECWCGTKLINGECQDCDALSDQTDEDLVEPIVAIAPKTTIDLQSIEKFKSKLFSNGESFEMPQVIVKFK